MKKSFFSFTIDELRSYLVERSFPKFSADQIYRWVYKDFIVEPNDWSNVSKQLKTHFYEELSMELPQIEVALASTDGTRKFLLKLNDGNTIEAVAIPSQDDRLTFCVSSQVGCCIGCTFCNTATQGLTRHLTTEEIVGQYMSLSIWLRNNVSPELKATNLVYMGQGEPLHNFDNVKKATEIFLEDNGIMLGQRRVTLSTSGLVPQIQKLNNFPPVNIAISLHAAHDNIRSELMPINKVYDLKRLFSAIKEINLKSHRSITYEYLLIADLNDRQIDVDALISLLDRKKSKINLIPFNEYPGSVFKKPSESKITWFKEQLLNRGYVCTVRISKGQDIMAACGQLKSSVTKPSNQ